MLAYAKRLLLLEVIIKHYEPLELRRNTKLGQFVVFHVPNRDCNIAVTNITLRNTIYVKSRTPSLDIHI